MRIFIGETSTVETIEKNIRRRIFIHQSFLEILDLSPGSHEVVALALDCAAGDFCLHYTSR